MCTDAERPIRRQRPRAIIRGWVCALATLIVSAPSAAPSSARGPVSARAATLQLERDLALPATDMLHGWWSAGWLLVGRANIRPHARAPLVLYLRSVSSDETRKPRALNRFIRAHRLDYADYVCGPSGTRLLYGGWSFRRSWAYLFHGNSAPRRIFRSAMRTRRGDEYTIFIIMATDKRIVLYPTGGGIVYPVRSYVAVRDGALRGPVVTRLARPLLSNEVASFGGGFVGLAPTDLGGVVPASISGSSGATIRRTVPLNLHGYADNGWTWAVSPDGKWLAYAGSIVESRRRTASGAQPPASMLEVYSLATGRLAAHSALPGTPAGVDFAPDGGHIAVVLEHALRPHGSTDVFVYHWRGGLH